MRRSKKSRTPRSDPARPPGNLGRVSYPLANAMYQWEEGARALSEIDDPRERRLADRVVEAIREELRRRIGPTFTAEELADLYGRGTDWAAQIANDVAPAIEGRAQEIADAAFWAYLRGAGNFAGGRQLMV
jgi:hypothetical protein